MGQNIFSDASGSPSRIWLDLNGAYEEKFTDTEIIRLTTAQAEVMAATYNAVYSFSGSFTRRACRTPPRRRPTTSSSIGGAASCGPFFQQGTRPQSDDYKFILGFGGRTYAWIAQTVMEYDPSGDTAGWKDVGLSGLRCNGACVSAGHLIVSIVTAANRSQLWAWDGSGWWLLPTTTPPPASSCSQYQWPAPDRGTSAWSSSGPGPST